MIMCTFSSRVLITPDDLVFIASKHNRCGVAATFVWFSHLPQFLPFFTLSRFALSNLWTWYPLLSIKICQPPNSPPSSKSRKWVISRGAEKKVNQFQAGNLDWFVSSTKLGFCSFTWPAGRINLPLMRVFVANWARLPPCPSCPRLLASRAQHMKCLFDESRSHSCQSSRAVLTGQSWCLLIERLDLAELDLVQKIAATGESGRKLRDGGERWRLVLKLVRSYRLLPWWHLWLLRDFRE